MGHRARSETMAIWEAQGKVCAVCGVKMLPVTMDHPTSGWTIEHVYNQASRRFHAEGNKLLSHAKCNNLKADRDPTGCELLMLHAVNAALGYELTPRRSEYRDNVQGPSALALALEQALAA